MTDATIFGTLPDDTDPAGLWFALLRTAPIGLAVIDRKLCYCLINPLLAEANGRSVAEHLGRSVREVLPDIAPMLEPLLRQVLDSGVALIDVEGCVPPLHAREQPPREWIASYLPYRNCHDEIAGVIAMVREVSGERQAERLRQKIEARCQQVVESALDGLIMIDHHGTIVLVNPAAEAMFGYRREELIGQPLSILIPARFLPRHDDLVTAYLHCPTGRSLGQQRGIIGRRRDGSEFPAEVGLSPLHNSDGLQVLATITDMSASMAAQAQIEQSLREKTALLNEVHHRVKNNLQVISSLLNLQTRHASPETRRVMTESQNHVKAMALIHQLLYERGDFSRVHMGVYLQRLLILLQHSMNPDSQQVQLTHRGLDTPVFLDLQRAIPCGLLVNELVTNALKHAFPDGRSGHIEVVLSGSANHQAELQINDDGVGIPNHIQPGTVSTLGFQLLPMLVEQLKGQWELQRKPEGGTRITLCFTGSSHEESADDAR